MRDNLVSPENPPIADIPECERMTVLSTNSQQFLTKRHTLGDGGRISTASYDNPAWFRVDQGPVTNFGQLVRNLDDLCHYPRSCVIRGEPLPHTDREKTRRLVKDHPQKGPATFREAPRRWVILDIDNFSYKTDNPLDLVNGDLMAREIRKTLPEPFREVSAWWGLTSGAGLFLIDDSKQKAVKMRMAFLLDKPLGRNQLESLFAGSVVDMSLFRPVQVHYLAAPIFQEIGNPNMGDLLLDHVPSRTGVIEGDPEVTGIEPQHLTLIASNDQPRPRAIRPSKTIVKVPGAIEGLPIDPRGAEGYVQLRRGRAKNIHPGEVLAYAVNLVRGTPEAGLNPFGGGGRHNALVRAVLWMAKHYVKRELIQPEDVRKSFHTAAMAMGLTDIDRQIANAFELAGADTKRISGLNPIEGLPIADVPAEIFEANWREDLITHWDNEAGEMKTASNIYNAILFLRFGDNFKGCLAYDELAQDIVATPPWDDGELRQWKDEDDTQLHAWFSKHEEIGINRGDARACVAVAARHRKFHPVADYLNGLKWDETPRIDSWLSTYCPPLAAPDQDTARFVSAAGAAFLIAAVARALSPGCKVDHVLVMVSPQGTGKSTTLASMMPNPEWFADQLANIESKDASQDLAGKWVLELAELSVMRRAKDAEAIKAFVTRRVDHYRPSYGRTTMDFKRSCIFAGTTNDRQFLSDRTGNRRFWPVEVGTADIEGIKRDRDQLWSEAVHRFKGGEPWHLAPEIEAIAQIVQADHLEQDPLEEKVLLIAQQISEPRATNPYVTTGEICERLNMHDSQRGGAIARRVADILRCGGWEDFRVGSGKTKGRLRAWRQVDRM